MATKHKVITTDAEISAALEQAKQLKDEARIVRAKYLAAMQAFVFQLNDGTFQAISKDKLEAYNRAHETNSQKSNRWATAPLYTGRISTSIFTSQLC